MVRGGRLLHGGGERTKTLRSSIPVLAGVGKKDPGKVSLGAMAPLYTMPFFLLLRWSLFLTGQSLPATSSSIFVFPTGGKPV